MGKTKYVNFARKSKFKGHKGQHKNGTNTSDYEKGKQQPEKDERDTFSHQKRKTKKASSLLKCSLNEEEAEIKSLQQRCADTTLLSAESVETFTDFPLSRKTLAGLNEANFTKPTVIQRESLPAALCGKDVLAAAKTGSGKTLAFVIPILERLYVEKWSRLDGLGALIITPTRELAIQIFETMGQVGKHHDFTIGLIIGGQNLKYERNRLHNLNVIIGTPGRLQQHMDENPLFDATNLKVLVLDEADRCLDMGFSATMNCIIENLPDVRQTLLFSATQTNSVKDLARVKLCSPVNIAPHQHEEVATPVKLQQSYVIVDLSTKLTMLWSFLLTHPKQKIIVFFSTCKQVKYVYQIFKKLRPSILLLPLYGGMNQEKRNKIYSQFCTKKNNVCMLATDIASRGLDFPKVNWVVQMDCPEDVTQYIHRAGRTARLNTSGENLLVLLSHEEKGMLKLFENSRIPIKRINIDSRQLFSPLVKMQALLAQSPELKDCAKRAFVAYVKSVSLMKNKDIFQVKSLPLDEFAKSLGLSITPRVRFLSRTTEGGRKTIAIAKNKTRIDCVQPADSSDDEDGDSFLKVKRGNHNTDDLEENNYDAETQITDLPTEQVQQPVKASKKRPSKIKLMKNSLLVGKRIVYDEQGIPVDDEEQLSGAYDLNEARLKLEQEDAKDKDRYNKMKKALRTSRKEKENQRKANNKRAADEDDFGSESDTNIDLDWLPDPDKVYKKSKHAEDYDQEEVSGLQPVKKKHCILHKTQDLSLNEAEHLAMNLLQ